MADPRPLVRVADRPPGRTFRHPLNPRSEMRGWMLGDLAGLTRIGVHLVTLAPGRESNMHHAHASEEEFYFVVSGRGVMEIGDEEHEVGPGDFVGFPAPSPGHMIKNPFGEDLVYLVGGERRPVEVGSFPRIGKRLVRVGAEAWLVDESALQPLGKADS